MEMRIFWIRPSSWGNTWMTVLPSSKASCKPPVALLGTDVAIPRGVGQQPSRDVGFQLGSGAFAGVCAAWTLHASWDHFRVPFIRVLGSQVLCLTGGKEGAEVRWNSVPVRCNGTVSLRFILAKKTPPWLSGFRGMHTAKPKRKK